VRRLFRIATVVVATALLLPASGAGAESATPTNWKVAPHSGAGRLAGVSCFGPHACVAVGSVGDDEPTAIVERWNGSVRRADRNFRAGPRTWLNAVSCVSSTACVAVGGTAAFVFAPVIERWDGRRWRSQGVTVDNRSAELRGISCVAADDCMAVGADWYVDSDALAAHWDGHHWSPTPRAPLPRGAQSSFTAVSCPRRDFCTATGTLTYPNYAPTALIEHWDGRQWSIAWATPAGGGSRILSAVSCVDSAHCVAVGWTSSRAARRRFSRAGTEADGAPWSIRPSTRRCCTRG
jgi:hypothetical protein